jgi:single-stranded DNA-binding protein
MSGYGMSAWTCGKCGERFESDGVVGDLRVERWRRDHLEEHRVAEMSAENRQGHYEMLASGTEVHVEYSAKVLARVRAIEEAE